MEKRLADSLEVASRVGQQVIKIEVQQDTQPIKELRFSQKFACAQCGSSFPELVPSLFSFNSPNGACPLCGGLGTREKAARKTKNASGASDTTICNGCNGARLRKESLAVRIAGKNIAQVAALPIAEVAQYFEGLRFEAKRQLIAGNVLAEIIRRLRLLAQLGLDYLTLDRRAETLSGGEVQRVRLAMQLGSNLAGVLYILDEPSIGLHQKDNAQLLELLKGLRNAGNSILIVEHDAETILTADYVVDMGPGAGVKGGQVVAQGSPGELMAHEGSLTGNYLSGRKKIPTPSIAAKRFGRVPDHKRGAAKQPAGLND